ncbi:protein of unknown function [Daejeonella rubra]|uniref:DUF1835 domain-containing protein n=1 Tax=Daejeonella rubra TaxID=990371 RepID=A0A1G9MQI8_9SPHI|nr:DUF1835 domain-containing protein [Daejeonella rubra]SDL76363.1 protein of unknown function [Daejeonella rubra]
MSTYHILNGDCLAVQLRDTKINQDFIVCRECLIEGPLIAENPDDFWDVRAKFISDYFNVSTAEYYSKTVTELQKIDALPDYSEVCLWFENDLFCQTNMWFTISILSKKPGLKLFRVFPTIESKADRWKGFGGSTSERLEQSFSTKIQFSPDDIESGKNLWIAYQNGDLKKLHELSKTQSNCFEYLEEVCQAHSDRFPSDHALGRPERVVSELINTYSKEFQEVFSAFSEREGIYGFGDLQVKNMYDKLMQQH